MTRFQQAIMRGSALLLALCSSVLLLSAGGTSEASLTGNGVAGPPVPGTANAAREAPSGDTVINEAILTDELERHVRYLASDALGGRGLGSPGLAEAEEYIARSLSEAGWQPFPGRESYYAPFTVYEHGYNGAETYLSIVDGEGSRREIARYESGLRPFWFSATGAVTAEAVFAGYGVSAPEHGYNDYDGLDVEGKIVFVLRHEPPATKPTPGAGERGDDESEWSRHARFNEKAEEAKEHGAVGIVVVTDPLFSRGNEDFRSLRDTTLSESPPDQRYSGLPEGPEDMLSVHVSQEAAGELTAGWDRSLREVQEALNDGTPASALAAPVPRLSLSITQRDTPEEVRARNVVAVHGGSDPEGPWLLLGAHHDHLGSYTGRGDTVFNGADDNASGTALLLEVAERLAQRTTGDLPNLAVVAFSGEEEGLLGSRWMAENGPLTVSRVCHMVNLDMVGRNPDSPVNVYGESEVLRKYQVRGRMEAAENWPTLAFHGHDLEGYSDYYPYYDEGVPFTFLTTGLHEDYHRVTDEAQTVEWPHMKRIGDLVAHALITGHQELCDNGGISTTAVTP
jgi:hypothetical protein